MILTTSGTDEAASMAERVRAAVEQADLTGGGSSQPDDPRLAVTMCCGISVYRDGDTLDNMLFRSDQALYRGKEEGSNRVNVAN